MLEKPFCYGDTIARETISEFSEKPMQFLNIETEIKLAFGSSDAISDDSLIHEMIVLGLARLIVYLIHINHHVILLQMINFIYAKFKYFT